LCQHDLVGISCQLNDLVAASLVKRNVARHQRVRCQFESLYVGMRALDGAKKGCANASPLAGRIDTDPTYGAYGPFNDAPGGPNDALAVSGREYGLGTDVQVNGDDFFRERRNLQVVAEPTLLCESAHLDLMNDRRILWHSREDCVHV
jgi:hypothetical protein